MKRVIRTEKSIKVLSGGLALILLGETAKKQFKSTAVHSALSRVLCIHIKKKHLQQAEDWRLSYC